MSEVAIDRERLSARLAQLREEQGRGAAQLAQLEQQENALRETLLRIAGAIRVLSELLEADGTEPAAAP